jgi:hypothetical protein
MAWHGMALVYFTPLLLGVYPESQDDFGLLFGGQIPISSPIIG